MTQIITAVTQEYVLLATDRRLTYAEGFLKGQPYGDTCKVVNLCGTTGIAYSGVGEMKGKIPTHEWIAKILATTSCFDAPCAERTLVDRTPDGLSATPPRWRSHTFLLAGWAHFGDKPSLRPYRALITNTLEASGKEAARPLEAFNAFRRYLKRRRSFSFKWWGREYSIRGQLV